MSSEERQEKPRSRIPFFYLVFDAGYVPHHALEHEYSGSGTDKEPFIVGWMCDDVRDPMNFRNVSKWSLNLLTALSTLTVALASSAYSGGLLEIMGDLDVSEEVALLGVSLFVIGFAVGPLLWAPLSETYGRRNVFVASGALLTAFMAGTAGAQNIQTVLILRFMAGSLGSAPMAVAGGVIADIFPALSRGLALGLFVVAPFLGPTLGPIIGGFISESAGWRWVQGALAIISGVQWLAVIFLLPETYAPVLLRRRAERLSKVTGRVFRSKLDLGGTTVGTGAKLKMTLCRPWVLLFREPIVLLLSLYMAIIYGTLYGFFTAFPFVFQEVRGWSEGLGGLSFLGILVGLVSSVPNMFITHIRYKKKASQATTRLPPEARLPDSFLASIALTIGLFWFAWTNSPSVHWIVPILAGIPFGYGAIMVFLPCLNYLIDSYTIYAASVLAANSALRSMFGAAFPLFTGPLYRHAGIHWAGSFFAFLALACIPLPVLFYMYGARIRKRCHYAAEADAFMNRLLGVSS